MSRLRGAIVGFGNVAANGHWPALASSPDLEIVAVADPGAARRAAASALAPGIRAYESIEDLARCETIDFVDIATPPSSHAALSEFCLGQRWHVLCEKPLTLDPAVFASLARRARACGRVLFTMHNWKVAPIVQAAMTAIRTGRVGEVRHVDVLVWRNQPCKGAPDGRGSGTKTVAAEDWRRDPAVAGGGILVDHGWHNFYLLLQMVGAEPARLSCTLTRPQDDPASLEDSARVSLSFACADACLNLTWRAPARRNVAIVHGDAGTLVLDDDRLVVATRGAEPEQRLFSSALSAGSHHEDWFRALLPQFVAEVADDGVRGANLREAGWCVSLTDAAYRSAADGGREIAIQPPNLASGS